MQSIPGKDKLPFQISLNFFVLPAPENPRDFLDAFPSFLRDRNSEGFLFSKPSPGRKFLSVKNEIFSHRNS